MKHVYSFLLLSLFIHLSSQAQTWQWAKSGGSAIIPTLGQHKERARDITVDSAGNTYVISPIGGAFASVDGHDLEPNDYTLTKVDYVLAAFDCHGNYRWSKVIGGWHDDELDRVKTDTLGNVYTVGKAEPPIAQYGGQSETHFGNDTIISYNPDPNIGKRTHFIIQYSTEGDLNWLKMPQPEDYDDSANADSKMRSYDLNVTENGDAYWLVRIGPGTYADGALVNTEEDAEYIFHYDVNGNFIEGFPVAIDFNFGVDKIKMVRDPHTGRFYFGGYNHYYNDSYFINMNGEPINNSMFLGAYDANGNFLWKITNTNTDPYPNSAIGGIADLKLDPAGNIYITGYSMAGDSFAGHEIVTDESSFVVPFVAKLNPDGNLLWFNNAQFGFGGPAPRAMAINGQELAITGSYGRQLNWDDFVFVNEANTGIDVFMGYFDKNTGNLLNLSSINNVSGMNPNRGTSLTADRRGNYYLGGMFGYDLAIGQDTIYSVGGDSDFFIAKLGKEDCNCTLPEASFGYTANADNSIDFSFNGSTSYDELEWSFGDGQISTEDAPQHSYTDGEGTHWVCVDVYTDCGYDTFCQEVSSNLDIKTLDNPELYFYPNPAQESITVSTKEALDYIIYNLQGKQLQNGSLQESQRNISIENLSNGIYMLQLSNKNGARKTLKLVKE